MCTYQFSISDAAINRIRPAFKDETAIHAWMLEQLETAIKLFEVPTTKKNLDMELSNDVAWFKNNPIILSADDIDERSKYILEK